MNFEKGDAFDPAEWQNKDKKALPEYVEGAVIEPLAPYLEYDLPYASRTSPGPDNNPAGPYSTWTHPDIWIPYLHNQVNQEYRRELLMKEKGFNHGRFVLKVLKNFLPDKDGSQLQTRIGRLEIPFQPYTSSLEALACKVGQYCAQTMMDEIAKHPLGPEEKLELSGFPYPNGTPDMPNLDPEVLLSDILDGNVFVKIRMDFGVRKIPAPSVPEKNERPLG